MAEFTHGATAATDIAVPAAYSTDSNHGTGDEIIVRPIAEPTTNAPRWLYPTALLAVLLDALSIIILHVTGGGFNGHAPL